MNAIVVTDKQWAIGRSGDLLFSLPGDMKHFRTLTTGGTVIMGRKTLDSFPGGRPLPKRRNIVITRDPAFSREGCEIVHTPEDALALADGFRPEAGYREAAHTLWAAAAPYARQQPLACAGLIDAANFTLSGSPEAQTRPQ